MTIQDFVSLSGEILTQYYDNNITPFLDACHEDVLWIGPAEKQVIRTKKALVNTFLSELHELKFVLHDLVITPLATTSNRVVEIIMFFMVDTIWPDNSMNRVNQRIHLSWIMNNGVPQIRLCHISNAISYDERDTIYPVHYDSKFRGMPLAGVSRSERLSFKGTDKSLLFLNRNQILYIESHGRHSNIHTTSNSYEITESLLSLEKRFPDYFLRCHQSYLINPDFASSIERFKLTMSDGFVIPIPEKKYTQVKRLLLDFINARPSDTGI